MIRFLEPWWLLLLVPAIASLIWSYRQTGGMRRGRKRAAFLLRGLLITLAALALASPEIRRANNGICTIFVVDRSDSIGDSARKAQSEYIRQATRSLGDPDAAGVVTFGADAKVEVSPNGRPLDGTVRSKIDGSGSDIAGAIRVASGLFPDGKARRIVLLTDGNGTQGDIEAAAEGAIGDGAEFDAVALGPQAGRTEVVVLGVETPNAANEKQPIEVRATVSATEPTDAVVTLDDNGTTVSRQSVRLNKGENSIVFPARTGSEGFERYRITVAAKGDRDSRNNIGEGFTRINGPTRTLLVSSQPQGGALGRVLRESGLRVETRTVGTMPIRAEEWAQYEAVLLDDVNAIDFSESQMGGIAGAARDAGVGLAMIGGQNSFLPGGWYGTPVAEALPVSLDIKQRKSFAAASVAIIVDASGSMSMMEDGQQKIRLAATAAEKTAGMLSPLDRIGVAGSSDGIDWVVPMQSAASMAVIIPQIRRLAVTGGGIYIGPSIRAGAEILRRENNKTRHLIMLCDGADSTDWDGANATAAAMRVEKITTTIVAIGDGQFVPQLKQLAAIGGGRFFLARRAAQLPAIFTQDAAVMTRSAIEEGAFIPKLTANEEMLRGVPSQGTPPLLAYCLTSERPLARTALKTAKDDPLLAVWQYGLGQTLAFTSDAQPRWARQWVGWPGFAAFWSQAVRQIARRNAEGKYEIAATQSGGRGQIRLKATDALGNPIDGFSGKLRISSPDGTGRELEPVQVAPGEYEASFDAARLGSYIVSVGEASNTGNGVRVSSSGFSVAYPPEYRLTAPDRPTLERLATRSGGKFDPKAEETMRRAVRPGTSVGPLWPILIALIPFVLFADIATRRLILPWSELSKFFARVPKPATAGTESMGRLKAAKARVPKGSPASPTGSSSPAASVVTRGAATGPKSDLAAPRANSAQAESEIAKPIEDPVGTGSANGVGSRSKDSGSTTGQLLKSRRDREGKS